MFCECLSLQIVFHFLLVADSFKLNFFNFKFNSANSKAFHTVLTKIPAIKLQKRASLGNCFSLRSKCDIKRLRSLFKDTFLER